MNHQRSDIVANILMTIKPRHLHNILIGEKTFELRKTKPKNTVLSDYPLHVYLVESGSGGLIKGEFDCYFINSVCVWSDGDIKFYPNDACVTEQELKEYAGDNVIYAWKIDNVHGAKSEHIKGYTRDLDYKVRSISEFGFNRPPLSWCYIKDGDK